MPMLWEAQDKLREHTRMVVEGIESMATSELGGDSDVHKDEVIDDWVKQFEEFAGSQGMGSMETIVESMMQHLLSKDVLYEPMKEIGGRYPKWLEEHKSRLSKEECERYSRQCKLVEELNEVYETDSGNFKKIVELMQRMQECGQPPNDILQELAPDFEISNLGQLSPEMQESPSKCCIM